MQRKKIILAVLLSLIAGTLMAQEPEVTPLMSKDLKDFPGKEGLMITVEYPPGGGGPYPSAQCTCISIRAGGLRRDAGEGRKRSNADTGADLL